MTVRHNLTGAPLVELRKTSACETLCIKLSHGADSGSCGMPTITGFSARMNEANMGQKVNNHFDDLHPCRISIPLICNLQNGKDSSNTLLGSMLERCGDHSTNMSVPSSSKLRIGRRSQVLSNDGYQSLTVIRS